MSGPKALADVLPLVPPLTDEEWAARDAEVARQREAEAQAENRKVLEHRRAEALALGFPRRAVDAADACDETAAAIVRVRDWKVADENVLVLSGSAGCGKTVAATWWALRRESIPTFLRATAFAASSRYDQTKRDEWLRSSALVLDDLGTEYADTKGSFLTDLDELIDTFYGNRKPLLITTNCTADDFKARYGTRVVDRLRECGSWFSVNGKSMRRKP